MNKTFRRLLACVLVALPLGSVWGQANLIKNPSFEEEYFGRPKHWNVDRLLAYELTSKPEAVRTGSKALLVYQTGASVNAGYFVEGEGIGAIQGIQPNTKYTLSFWVKGEAASSVRVFRNIHFKWEGSKNTTDIVAHGTNGMGIRLNAGEWTEVKVSVTSPETATKVMVSVPILSDTSAGALYLDDFSLTAEAPKASAPAAPTATAHQRELEINWTAVSGASYELEVNGKTYTSTTGRQLVTGLRPGTDYPVKLKVTQGGSASDWTTTTLRTQPLTTSLDEEGRTPYLRTVQSDGRCSTTLGLFYNELHSDAASFTYFLDGQSVRPNSDNTLTLTRGEHILQVEVKESDERIYILTYNLSVN